MGTRSKKVLFSATVDSHILAFHVPFLKYFKEQGYEVHVATNGDVEIPYCDVKHVISFERSPFKLNNIKAIKQLKKIVDVEKYDIIHTHTPMGGVITRLASIQARKNGTRVIYTAHGFHFFKGAPILNWLIYYPIEKTLAYFTDTLVTINKEDFKRAQKHFTTDVRYIKGVGVDLKKFQPPKNKKEKNELRKRYGINNKDFVLIYAAELNKNKNQKFLITRIKELVADVPNIKLLLCGKGDFDDYYEALIRQYNLQDDVLLKGYRNDISDLFKASDVCVAASIREGFGVNLVESMACGLPVIASNNRGHRDVIGKNNRHGYLYNLQIPDQFNEHLLRLYDDKVLYERMSKDNVRYVDCFSLSNAVEAMAVIYKMKMSSNKYE